MSSPELNKLAKHLGFRWGSRHLLEVALTHSSWVNEHPELHESDNENLEFLGDAVLGLVVSHYLYSRKPDLSPGEYTRLRAATVNRTVLAQKAREIQLGAYIRLGRGEEHTSGHDKDSVLADALEAVIGARFIASGYRAAEKLVLRLFEREIDESCRTGNDSDYKSSLQNYAQELFREIPQYRVVRSSGPDHDRSFDVEVRVHGEVLGRGVGKSKKAGEQAAAQIACARIAQDRETETQPPDDL